MTSEKIKIMLVDRREILREGLTAILERDPSIQVVARFASGNEAMDKVTEIRPDIVNITRFSERSGTPAVKLEGKLHGRVLKARSRELTELCQSINLEKNRALIEKEFKVLAVERDIAQYKNTTLARTDGYKPVVIETELKLGKSYDVKIIAATESYLIGEINQ